VPCLIMDWKDEGFFGGGTAGSAAGSAGAGGVVVVVVVVVVVSSLLLVVDENGRRAIARDGHSAVLPAACRSDRTIGRATCWGLDMAGFVGVEQSEVWSFVAARAEASFETASMKFRGSVPPQAGKLRSASFWWGCSAGAATGLQSGPCVAARDLFLPSIKHWSSNTLVAGKRRTYDTEQTSADLHTRRNTRQRTRGPNCNRCTTHGRHGRLGDEEPRRGHAHAESRRTAMQDCPGWSPVLWCLLTSGHMDCLADCCGVLAPGPESSRGVYEEVNGDGS